MALSCMECGLIPPNRKSRIKDRNKKRDKTIRKVSALAILVEVSLGLRKARSAEKRHARMPSKIKMMSNLIIIKNFHIEDAYVK